MVFLIAKHRFLLNILSMRFTISFILCEVLFVASTLILAQDYKERLEQYGNSVQQHENALQETYTFAELDVGLDRTPLSLSIICEGADKRLGTSVTVAFDKAPTIAEERGTRNPLLAVFPSLDLVTVIEIVLSLLVIFLAYNTISGERERGTLKLSLSNDIARHTVLLGNFVGGMTSVVFPLIIGLLLSLLIIHTDSMIVLNANDYLRIVMIFFLAILYLAAFYSLGMLLSSRIRHSATVLILLLFIWVVSVIILPHTAVYAARQLVTVPDRAVIDSQAQVLIDEWVERMDDYATKNPWPAIEIMKSIAREFSEQDVQFLQTLQRGRRVYTGKWPYAYRFFYTVKEMMEWVYHGSIFGHNLRMEYEDKIWQLYRDYQLKLNKQVGLARALSLCSPSWAFSHGSSLIAGTSENNYLRFLEESADYRRELISYMRSKGGLDSYLLFTRKPIESFLSSRELIILKNSQGEEEVKNIMNYRIDPLDLSDLPRFNYSITDLGVSTANAIFEIFVLIFLNIFFFSLAWVSFLRADVR